ncbi:thioredoxin family protein [Nostoc sp. GT001]|uniref:thioredoxin family protein n=1 Tax=unclassified Nostoc TaxID=2593658 RepID=UPI000DFF4A2F|nr:thioredoxin family protein [Nostoc sp. GT001]MDM9580497.1 thioredoxin family protein [Nostoc sp. GT001]RCJ21309.1 thioredoxin [Nostoc sp. ATCC 43529]
MTKRQIEIFTADCPLCDETVQMVQELTCPDCEVSVYNLRHEQEKAQQYGVNAVPAIAINGKLVLTGKPNLEQLRAVGVGQPLN